MIKEPRSVKRLPRCVFAPVSIVSDEVSDFRRRFDSLYGKCPPHVTLAFPFVSDVSDGELSSVLDASSSRGAFDVTLLAPQLEGSHVLLPLEQPDPWLHSTYLELSRLVGASTTKAYRPHVTIGRGLTSAPASAMAMLPRRQLTRIERLVLEEIQEDESSRVLHEVVLRC